MQSQIPYAGGTKILPCDKSRLAKKLKFSYPGGVFPVRFNCIRLSDSNQTISYLIASDAVLINQLVIRLAVSDMDIIKSATYQIELRYIILFSKIDSELRKV